MAPVDADVPVPSPAVGGEIRSRRPLLLGAAGVVGLGAGLVRVAVDGPAHTVAGSVLELVVLLVLLAWAGLRWRAVREAAAGIGRWRSAVVVALVMVVLAGQHLRHVDLYPFEPWDMYTRPAEASGYLDLQMRADGRDLGHLPVADALPGTSIRPYLAGLLPVAVRAWRGDAEAVSIVTRAVRALVVELGPRDVDTVAARLCVVQDPSPEAPSECRLLLEVPVDGGAGP